MATESREEALLSGLRAAFEGHGSVLETELKGAQHYK